MSSTPSSTESKKNDTTDKEYLVHGLVNYFKNQGLVVACATCEGFEDPVKVGEHQPDVIAHDKTNDLFYIGHAKTCDDLSSERIWKQIRELANLEMTGGKSQGQRLPYFLAAPDSCIGDFKHSLENSDFAIDNIRLLKI